ncbi:8-amino-7-oxononanoate synthase [Pantoea agglomerans]|jgi:8-amino-7-oxononanoate synthase|uniref:8-amino-7-oxononanoate synthase n=1 Tax=Pantoea TaxID=53335 RepID=UPI00045C9715|nr:MULTISPECIES: 8-amino-7-oxononanoate synthase [Pantoea]KAF6680204.1 8-amino-7-oxononanoate synthase [Pantoea sp. EKM21T]KAF6684432.1 8-amino-7-oxononanoate synthase [Pantoea sp. EKM22T]KDA95193.1 8-amino-7-oxononanoate synthase [Pantoea agglomerans Eh318]KYN64745.1 8-amino-7-oxononanoate synthase [Pantoea agglomerans]MBO0638967.1 8-amino-7-oxononanoate synthase [Pantoea agglomerans]
MGWQQRIRQALTQRRAADGWRQRRVIDQQSTRTLHSGGRSYLHFSSNDYLGLTQHPAVIAGWQQGAAQAGAGAGASGHVTGYHRQHADLEAQLADWLGYDRALLFISGFAANQAVIHLLGEKNDRILADKLSHASLLDAASHSPAQLRRFHHNAPESLAARLASPCEGETLVVTEGIFSMDGDSAPLAALAQQTRQAEGWLLVDDAHGIGVVGEQGRGSCWQQDVKPELLVVTFGKAFGVSGAALLCDAATADYFLQFSRHLIYSTAMPAAQASALQAALREVQQGDALRQQLQQNIGHFRRGAASLPWQLMDSGSAIQPLLVGENGDAMALSQRLAEAGCWVSAIRPPTVPPGTARLRITLTAAHRPEDIDRLLEALHDAAG